MVCYTININAEANRSMRWNEIQLYLKDNIVVDDIVMFKNSQVRVVNKDYNTFFIKKDDGNIIKIPSQKLSGLQSSDVDVSDVVIGECSSSILNTLRYYWNILPQNIKSNFIENGWKIEIEGDLGEKYYGGKPVYGMTSYSNKVIRLSDSSYAVDLGFMHEFGHYVDYVIGIRRGISHPYEWVSYSEEFTQIYEEEVSSMRFGGITNIFSLSSREEYFACCFSNVLLYPSTCRGCGKRTYKYMLDLIQSI